MLIGYTAVLKEVSLIQLIYTPLETSKGKYADNKRVMFGYANGNKAYTQEFSLTMDNRPDFDRIWIQGSINVYHQVSHKIAEVSPPREKSESKGVKPENRNPQTQTSRIESGQADLRVSTLVELARSLELELVLIPRLLFTAVNNIIQKKSDNDIGTMGQVPAYQLGSGDDDE